MLSAPPTRASRLRPAWMAYVARWAAVIDEQQARSSVSDSRSSGTPALSMATRPGIDPSSASSAGIVTP